MIRYVRWRLHLQAFLLAIRLMRWALRDPHLSREVDRLIRFFELVGTIEGFAPADPPGLGEVTSSE